MVLVSVYLVGFEVPNTSQTRNSEWLWVHTNPLFRPSRVASDLVTYLGGRVQVLLASARRRGELSTRKS